MTRASSHEENGFLRRVLTTVGVVAVTAIVILLVFLRADALFVIFAGILLAILLGSASHWIAAHTPVRYHWALALLVLSGILFFVLSAGALGQRAAEQVGSLIEQLPNDVHQLERQLARHAWFRLLFGGAPPDAMHPE